MRLPPVIQKREAKRMAMLLIALVAVAAAINVPWAVTMIRPENEKYAIRGTVLQGDQLPRHWPSRTPHDKPWPPPKSWVVREVFGCRNIDVTAQQDGDFVMKVQHDGWPLPVLEFKQTYCTNPSFGGERFQGGLPSLMWRGLLLNPLILGGGAWLALILPWLIFTVIRRTSRWRNARCIACGYPVGTSDTCTECGAALMHHAR